MPGGDQDGEGGAHQGDVQEAGDEPQPGGRLAAAGEAPYGQPEEEGEERAGDSDPGLGIGRLGEHLPEGRNGDHRADRDPHLGGE
jgi:hypothetical protein